MTPALSRGVFVVLVIGWYLIRYEYARRSRREKIVSSARGPRLLKQNLLLHFSNSYCRAPRYARAGFGGGICLMFI